MAALLWLIVGLLLIAAEVLTMDLTLVMLGVSALAAAAVAGLGAPIPVQLLTFGLVAIGAVTLARPILRRRLHSGLYVKGHYVRTNVEALVGTKAVVVSRVDGHGGEVKISGEIWSARTYDETQALEPGRPVTVMGISGATAVVWGDL